MLATVPNRLVVTHQALQTIAAELLTGRQLLAQARIRRNFGRWVHEYLIDDWSFAPLPSSGIPLTSADDSAALAGPDESLSTQRLLDQTQLHPGQQLLLLRLGLGLNREQWQGCVRSSQSLQPLDEIKIVGPGMSLIQRQPEAESSEDRELAIQRDGSGLRWSRLVGAIGAQAVTALHRQRILLIGAGRNGSLMAESLVRLGVERLLIADADDLGMENLDATLGSNHAMLGRPKVHSLARHLFHIRSHTQIVGLRMDSRDWRIIDFARDVDWIVTCVDSDAPRLAAAKLASRYLKIHLDVGSVVRRSQRPSEPTEMGIDVRLLLPGSCIVCVGGLRDLDGAERALNRLVPPLTPGLRRGHQFTDDSAADTGKTGSLFSLNQIAVGSAVQLMIDLVSGNLLQSYWLRTLWTPGRGPQTQSVAVAGNQRCPVCATGK